MEMVKIKVSFQDGGMGFIDILDDDVKSFCKMVRKLGAGKQDTAANGYRWSATAASPAKDGKPAAECKLLNLKNVKVCFSDRTTQIVQVRSQDVKMFCTMVERLCGKAIVL